MDAALTLTLTLTLTHPGQRLSIFSVFRKALHANAELFCSLGPQDRENRQPLDRERDLERSGINRAKPASGYCGKCETFQRFHDPFGLMFLQGGTSSPVFSERPPH